MRKLYDNVTLTTCRRGVDNYVLHRHRFQNEIKHCFEYHLKMHYENSNARSRSPQGTYTSATITIFRTTM